MSKGLIGLSTAEVGRFSMFYASLGTLQKPDEVMAVFARSAVISENRNNITEEALKQGVDWVLYVDDDQIFQPDTLMRLLAADKDVISAHYIQRQYPFNPVIMETELPNGKWIWKQLRPDETGIITCAAAGAGCLLVRRKVLEALEPPYWRLGQISPASWGDDLDFCKRVRAAGFDIHVDLDNKIGHTILGVAFPVHDAKHGWVAAITQDPGKPPFAFVPMPLPGDIK